MKNISLLLFLALPFVCYSQDKIPFADGQALIEMASKAGAEGNYQKSLEILDRMSLKDSSYCSALISKSYYLLNLKKFEEAVVVADRGLKTADCGPVKLSYFVNKGVALLNNDDNESALETFSRALELYPRNAQLWYNKGLVLENLKMTREAVSAYQNAILFNPSYARPHLKLGDICYKQEMTAQAMMCYNTYLLLNPDGDDSFRVLKGLNELIRIKNPNSANKDLEISMDEGSFDDLNLILDNRLALNEQYKVKTDIEIPLSKQNHLLMEQLVSYKPKEGFWAGTYVPLYQWIWKNNYFEQFTHTISFSIENERYKEIVRKDVDDIKSFLGAATNVWLEILGQPDFRVNAEDEGLTYYYHESRLDGIGKKKEDVYTGLWTFYNSQGELSGQGEFDGEGERTGKWTWYHPGGVVKETALYKKGELHGENKGFFSNGRLRYSAHYEKDQLHGEHLVYNDNGALLEKKIYSNGLLEGDYQSYFKVGKSLPEFDIIYRKDLVEDRAVEYYAEGGAYSEMNFRNGEKEGVEKRYNRDGSLYSAVNYVKGEPQGLYETYYLNGNTAEKGYYEDGVLEGLYQKFYLNGNLQSSGKMKKGLSEGVHQYFAMDGKLHNELDFKNDEVIGYRFYDKKGKILAQGKRRGGEFWYEGYSPEGIITSTGLYDVSGGKKGEWKFFSDNGVLTGEGTYIEDKADGVYKEYYETGEKFSVSEYKLDTLDGYYTDFYKNGQMRTQGWYQGGFKQGEWRTYFIDGNLQAKNFYHKGDLHDEQEYFGVKAKKLSTLKYHFGKALSETFFDPQGKLFQEHNFDLEGENLLKTLHFNSVPGYNTSYVNGVKHGAYSSYDIYGNKILEGNYLNGSESGSWTSYFENGTKESSLNFSRGELHGEVLDFYEDGQVESKRIYSYGKIHGKSESFHDNGQLSVSTNYFDGQEHGRKEFYDYTGNLQLVRFYEYGRLIGYTYLDENSEELPMIKLENESGIVKAYFDNGKISREIEYMNGEVKGMYRAFNYSGKPEYEAAYTSGEFNGAVTEYYSNGERKSEENYLLGYRHGLSKKFYSNGKLKEETNYLNGVKHGISTHYNELGKPIKKEKYFNDSIYEVESI